MVIDPKGNIRLHDSECQQYVVSKASTTGIQVFKINSDGNATAGRESGAIQSGVGVPAMMAMDPAGSFYL